VRRLVCLLAGKPERLQYPLPVRKKSECEGETVLGAIAVVGVDEEIVARGVRPVQMAVVEEVQEAGSDHRPTRQGCIFVRVVARREEMGRAVKTEGVATWRGCQLKLKPEWPVVERLNGSLELVHPHLRVELTEEAGSPVRARERSWREWKVLELGCPLFQCSLPGRIQTHYLLPPTSSPGRTCRIPPIPHLQ
jgi:hypothetical protein